jgi:dihydroorotase-like cyclic amidohydrolase
VSTYQPPPCPAVAKTAKAHEFTFKGKVNVAALVSLKSASFTLGSATTKSVGANSAVVIPAGVFFVFCGPNTKVQVNDGTNWQDLTATGGKALVVSDGVNVRLFNTGTAAENSTLRQFV